MTQTNLGDQEERNDAEKNETRRGNATKRTNNERINMKLEPPPPPERPDHEDNQRSILSFSDPSASPADKDNSSPSSLPSKKRQLALSKKSVTEQELDSKGQSANDRAAAEAVKNENGLYVCPLCEHVLHTSHDFTVHIRQHNPNDHSHTCRLCGKTLSSASSLDRHMLVHSGERPFKCKLCSMAFTTNGNMHRHMRTHGEEAEAVKPVKETTAGGKTKGKRKSEGKNGSGSTKKEFLDCRCPVCDKALSSKKQFETHMETHPHDSVYCHDCQEVLPNYDAMKEHQCPKKPEPSVNAVGFQELSFVDFSASKFSLIAKTYCETNSRRPSSVFHAFECTKCDKSFPCGSALRLHSASHTEPRGTLCTACGCDFTTPTALQAHQLKHRMAEHCGPVKGGKENGTKSNSLASSVASSAPGVLGEPEEAKKEDFLAVLQLKNRDEQPKITKLKIKREKLRENDFENMTYFVHGRPEPSPVEHPVAKDPTESRDFADIQSMISVTSKSPLMSGIRSSPVVATPASPLQATPSACVSPESPIAGDSANASPETPSKEDSEHSSVKGSEDADTDGGAIVQGIYTCKLCDISFKKISALKRHNRNHLQSCSSYSCSLCPYNSLDKSTLIRHLRTHNGERPFQCVICKYAFTTKANCERHVRKRHKKLNKGEIRCAMQYNPNMGDGSSSEVLPPEMNGSETICKYCSVDFKSNRVLRHHLRSLHNSCRRKPFFCTLCKLGFSTKNNCIRHVAKQHPEMKDKLRDIVISNGNSDMSDQESIANNSDDNALPPTPDRTPEKQPLRKQQSDQKNVDRSSETIDYSKQNENETVLLKELASVPSLPPPPSPCAPALPPPSSLASLPKQAIIIPPMNRPMVDDQPLNLTVRPASFSNKLTGSQNGSGVDDMVSAANGLVSLSEILPPQEEPLDLALHALDLSVKYQKKRLPYAILPRDLKSASAFSSNARRYAMMPYCPPVPTGPLRLPFRGPLTPQTVAMPLASGPAVMQPLPSMLALPPPPPPSVDSAHAPLLSSNSNGGVPPPTDNAFRAFKIVNDRLSPRNQRSFSCMYCSAGFTLKSNMERHIKRKHPEFARPTRSRNFIPTLSPTISKNNMSTLSNKTRDALRVVLSNKAGSSTSNAGSTKEDSAQGLNEVLEEKEDKLLMVQEESQHSEASSMDHSSISIHETATGEGIADNNERSMEEGELFIECPKECEDDEQESATDLASVSSVIDTANSQQIQQYLMSTENEEDMEDDLEVGRDSEGCNPDNSDPTSSPTSSGTAKKRSSYMDSPNSVACPFCFRKFPWTSSLRRHILTHTGQKPYKCPRCPIWFTTKSNCERHLVRKHGQNSDILTRSVPERPYKCNVCPSSTFSTRGNLRKHYYLKHLTKTGSGSNMRKQLRLLDPELADENPDDEILEEGEDEEQEEDGSDEESMDCEEGTNNEEGIITLEKKDGNFNNVGHQNELPFKCHLCEESFAARADCLAHIESLHADEYKQLVANSAVLSLTRPDMIDKISPSNNNNNNNSNNNNNNNEVEDLTEQKESSESRKVMCAFCSRKFWSAEDLRRHMRTHSGERPFACDICQRAFSLKHSMIRHRRKHFGKLALSAGHQESSDDDAGPPPLKVDLTLPKPKKQIQNSLLYLMSQTESGFNKLNSWKKSSSSGKLTSGGGPASGRPEEDTDLIQNLLGIQDSKMIDEMLDSADSAARLLGVKKLS